MEISSLTCAKTDGSLHPQPEPKEALLSIIMPTYNAARTIEQAVYSIDSQDYQPIELIVIDNESTDKTLGILNQSSTRTVVVSERDNGIYSAFNKGLDLASGDWVIFMGAADGLRSVCGSFALWDSEPRLGILSRHQPDLVKRVVVITATRLKQTSQGVH
jgi:glycosyltransferase involved in cell wall biosynthesis